MRTDLFCEFGQKFKFIIHITRIAYYAAKTRIAVLCESHYGLAEVVCSIERHEFPACHDVYFFGVTFPYGHSKASAYYVTEHIIEDEIEVFIISSELLKQFYCRDNSSSGAAHAWFGTSCLDALYPAKASVLDNIKSYAASAVVTHGVQYRCLHFSPEEHPC